MASSWNEEFFSQFTPLIRDGQAMRTDDGMLLFVRAADGEYVKFHCSQIQMDELDSYIRSELVTPSSDAVTDSQTQFELQTVPHGSSASVHTFSSPSSVMISSPNAQQPMHLLQSLQGVLQVQVSQDDLQNQHLQHQLQQQSQHHQAVLHQPSQPHHHHHHHQQHHQQHDQHLHQQLQQQQLQLHHQQQQQQHLQLHQPPPQQQTQQEARIEVQTLNTNVKPHVVDMDTVESSLSDSMMNVEPMFAASDSEDGQSSCLVPTPEALPSPVLVRSSTNGEYPMTPRSPCHGVFSVSANTSMAPNPDFPVTHTVSPANNGIFPMSQNSTATNGNSGEFPESLNNGVFPISTSANAALYPPPVAVGATSSSTAAGSGKINKGEFTLSGKSEKDSKTSEGAKSDSTSKTSSQSSNDTVWASLRTPEARQRDREAMKALIDIVKRPEIQAKMNSKSHKKKAIWQEIGLEMAKFGFVFDNPGSKCAQKWRNIERSYKDYELSKHMPDVGLKRLPEFYDELKVLLQEKHVYGSEAEQQSGTRLMEEYVDRDNSNEANLEPNGQISPPTCNNSSRSSSPRVQEGTGRASVSTVASMSGANVVQTVGQSSMEEKDTNWSPLACDKDDLSQSLDLSDSEMLRDLPHSFGELSASVPATTQNAASPQTATVNSANPDNALAQLLSVVKAQGEEITRLRSESAFSQVLHVVKAQGEEISRLSSEVSTIKELLLEQKFERDLMRTEASLRFEELKNTIEQNQREKMKFMCDYLKTVQALMDRKKKRKERKDGGGSSGDAI